MSDSSAMVLNNLRIGGLASGLDTDSIVENMMKAEKAKVFRIEQEKQIAEWQQTAYRDIIGSINDFIDAQYNLTNSSQNILSSSGYKSVTINTTTEAVSIMANGDAVDGTFTINEIVQLATASKAESTAVCKGSILGTQDLSSGDILVSGQSFNVRLDGQQQTISFDSDYASAGDFQTALQQKLDEAFGANRVTASLSEDKYLELTAANSTVQVLTDVNGVNALDTLGLSSGDQNVVNLSGSVASVFGQSDALAFSINGVDFSFSADTSIRSILSEINGSDAGVTLTYNSLSDTFTLKSNQTGAGSAIVIENTSGNMFGPDSFLNISSGTIRNGQDAKIYLNDSGKTSVIQRSSNVFTIDGVTFALKAANTEPVEYRVENDIDTAKERITSYVAAYNALLEEVRGIITEQRDYDYSPLSDEQKDEMTEEEVERWEEEAKKGLLKGDTTLYALYNSLRDAFVTPISGAETSFSAIGISSLSYEDHGKLNIDETKLQAALQDDFEGVMELFSKESEVAYSRDLSQTDAAQRYSENGFAQRVRDIFKTYVTTTRNSAGYKGLLLEKAGLVGDTTEFSSALSKLIESIEERIETATERMEDKEDTIWDQFTSLELSINQMNSQSQYMLSQFSME